jgi:hypothetical protein
MHKFKQVQLVELKILVGGSKWILRDILHLHHNSLKWVQNQTVRLLDELLCSNGENNRNE